MTRVVRGLTYMCQVGGGIYSATLRKVQSALSPAREHSRVNTRTTEHWTSARHNLNVNWLVCVHVLAVVLLHASFFTSLTGM